MCVLNMFLVKLSDETKKSLWGFAPVLESLSLNEILFPCVEDFEFKRKIPSEISPVLETLSLNKKKSLQGFRSVLETLSLNRKNP